MSPERWERVQDLVMEALDLHESDRKAFLDKECSGDTELRESVESLLKVRDADKSFLLDKPAVTPKDGSGAKYQPPVALHEFKEGERISHFEIEAVLGRGGMGVVYKARDVDLDRPVALKFISPLLAADDEARRRLLLEAKTTSALDHPNICTIYEIGWADVQDESHAYIAMAYYEGETLNQVIERGPLEAETALEYIVQIAQGLEAAHEAGIVHRDIKPSNILVTSKNVAKILDFGIARSMSTDVTKTQGTSGTLHYMSPEQVQGVIADERTDVWALGVVLHEMLTGKRPFTGEYEASVIYAILNETPGPPSSTNRDIPAVLDEVVSRAVDKDLTRRYQNMGEFLADLEAIAAGQGPVPIPSSAGQSGLRNKRLVGASVAGILVVALLVAGALFSGFFSDSSSLASRLSSNSTIEKTGTRQDKLIAVLPFQFVGQQDYEYLGRGIYMTLALALNGAEVVESVDYNAIFGLLGGLEGVHDPEIGVEVASYFGAGRFMMGNVTQHGDRFRVTGIMYDHEGNMLHTLSGGDIAEADFVHAVDSMALEIISSEAGEEYQGLLSAGLQMTTSVEALKAFVEAERLRRAQFLDNSEAIEKQYERAAKLDTNFALPVIRQVGHLAWRSEQERRREAEKRLTPLLDRLPARERQEAEILLALDSLDYHERLAGFKALLDRWPDYAWAWYYYADTIFHNGFFFGQPAEESQEASERALLLDPGNSELAYHLVDFAARAKDFDRIDTLESLHNGLRFGRPAKGIVALGRGERDAWLAERPEFESAAPLSLASNTWRTQFYGLYEIADTLIGIANERPDIMNDPQQRFMFEWFEGLQNLMKGRVDQADSLFMSIFERSAVGLPEMVIQALSPFQPINEDRLTWLREVVSEWDTTATRIGLPNAPYSFLVDMERGRYAEVKLFMEGALAYKSGDPETFKAALDELGSLASREGHESVAYVLERTLTAIRLKDEGDLEGALESLAQARIEETFSMSSSIRSQAWHRLMTAEILFEQGRYREALRWVRSVNESGWISVVGVAQWHGPVWYRRARIHDELGEDELALEYYQRFIDIWEDADPELQHWVEDAQARREGVIERQVREPT